MITLTIDPIVLRKLKQAMPKTNKAELALERYVDELTHEMEKSLMYMDNNMYKFFKHFYLGTHAFDLATVQKVISGKKQYLRKWLDDNGLALFEIIETGQRGSDVSTIALTNLVTMSDAMDITMLRKKKINELDALLNDKSLNDEDFFYRLFPDFATMTTSQLKQLYHLCPIDTKSLQQFIVWLTHKANKINVVERQMMVRQARVIMRIAQTGTGDLPMLINMSLFGRTYYRGINVQSVHKTLRKAMLGDCYEYDIRTSVVSWKMGYARLCYDDMKSQNSFENEFGTSLAYLEDKKAFRKLLMLETFGTNNDVADEVQLDIVKQALTAISFGARTHRHGWIDHSGKPCNPALVTIIKDFEARSRFLDCDVMKEFLAEQDELDKFIFKYHTEADASLLTNPDLQKGGRKNKSKIMAYLYQHFETDAMDAFRAELKRLGRTDLLASVHDAIFIRRKLTAYDKENIEVKMCQKTGIPTWKLDVDEIKAFTGISAEVLADERVHKLRMEELESFAVGYKQQNF